MTEVPELLRVADSMALYTLDAVSGEGACAHRKAIVVAYLALSMLKISYPRKGTTEVFAALQEAEGIMALLDGPREVV